MHKLVSQLVVYRNLPADNLLEPLADICAEFAAGDYNREELTAEIYEQVHKLLDIGTVYGFDKNLWHNYLAFLLVSCENPFAITCEKVGACDGSVNQFAKHDFKIFQQLFTYDFSELERALEINCFSLISNYQAVVKQERRYNKNISDKVQALRLRRGQAWSEQGLPHSGGAAGRAGAGADIQYGADYLCGPYRL